MRPPAENRPSPAPSPTPTRGAQEPAGDVRIDRLPDRWRLSTAVWLPRPRSEVFPFFADARNLERITPPWLNFNIVTPGDIDMRQGALIDYRLRVRAVPVRWRTRIALWDPPRAFVDEQLKGPYALWRHTHTFTESGGGTICEDAVEYRVPGGPLAPIANGLLVQRELRRIFEFRRAAMLQIFAAAPR